MSTINSKITIEYIYFSKKKKKKKKTIKVISRVK